MLADCPMVKREVAKGRSKKAASSGAKRAKVDDRADGFFLASDDEDGPRVADEAEEQETVETAEEKRLRLGPFLRPAPFNRRDTPGKPAVRPRHGCASH